MYGSVKTNAQLSPTLKYIYVCIFVRTTKKGLAYESNPFKPARSSFISSVVLADIDATVLQPPIYGRGPLPGGMPMMPMLLPDGRIGYSTATPCLLSLLQVYQSGILPSSNIIPNSSTFQSSNHASPMPSIHGIGSPAQLATEPLSGAALSPMKSSDITCTGQQSTTRTNLLIRDNAISSLCQLCCKIILTGLQSNLKPVTHADIFHHVLNWLVNWDQRQQGSNEFDGAKCWKPDKALIEWLHICLDVIWLLVEDDKCHVPFYELLRSGLQFIENIPDDEALFTLILEIHRWQDMMAMHM
ncbi:hypothetical protein ACSBR2_037624 [Camellia fascicularis]